MDNQELTDEFMDAIENFDATRYFDRNVATELMFRFASRVHTVAHSGLKMPQIFTIPIFALLDNSRYIGDHANEFALQRRFERDLFMIYSDFVKRLKSFTTLIHVRQPAVVLDELTFEWYITAAWDGEEIYDLRTASQQIMDDVVKQVAIAIGTTLRELITDATIIDNTINLSDCWLELGAAMHKRFHRALSHADITRCLRYSDLLCDNIGAVADINGNRFRCNSVSVTPDLVIKLSTVYIGGEVK